MGAQDRMTTSVSSKGQVILPKATHDEKHRAAGTKVIVEGTPEGVRLKSQLIFSPTTLEAVFGSLKPTKPALSIEDMNAVMAEEAKHRSSD